MRNASDPAKVKEQESKVKRLRERELDDVRYILQSQQGRRLMWRVLGHCKVHGSIWEPSAKIHYNSGVQDVGHFLMAEIVEANQDAFFQMMKEAAQGDL